MHKKKLRRRILLLRVTILIKPHPPHFCSSTHLDCPSAQKVKPLVLLGRFGLHVPNGGSETGGREHGAQPDVGEEHEGHLQQVAGQFHPRRGGLPVSGAGLVIRIE